jgi:hypothetical protein
MTFKDHFLFVTSAPADPSDRQFQCLVTYDQNPYDVMTAQHNDYRGKLLYSIARVEADTLRRCFEQMQKPEDGAEKEQCIAVWDAFPKCQRKVGKPVALRSIKKAIAHVGFDVLLAATNEYAAAVNKWSERDKEFIPAPATFFNQKRYQDDRQTWVRKDWGNKSKSVSPQHEKGW